MLSSVGHAAHRRFPSEHRTSKTSGGPFPAFPDFTEHLNVETVKTVISQFFVLARTPAEPRWKEPKRFYALFLGALKMFTKLFDVSMLKGSRFLLGGSIADSFIRRVTATGDLLRYYSSIGGRNGAAAYRSCITVHVGEIKGASSVSDRCYQ